ncbi:MAG: glycosyltransferase family 4 protein, partial [Patescibacteria group bacterium]
IDKKRPMDLLMAYENLKDSNKVLVFVGDGILKTALEKYVDERDVKNVHFVGFQNQTELPKFYAAADIFVLPSGVGETWGLVVNEAMCFSLPVIVSNMVGCGKSLVHHGQNGFIFELGNVEELTGFLDNLMADKNKLNSFGRESFKIVQRFSYKEDINGLLQALDYINNKNHL